MTGNCPGCEVYPEPDDRRLCGVPSYVLALCYVPHAPYCRYLQRSRFPAWMCMHHFVMARNGALGCDDCGNQVIILQLL